METFYLGTHQPDWLTKTDVPLFVSVRRLMHLRTLPRAEGSWALDSGGFSELSLHGKWTLSVASYIAEVRRYIDEIGKLQWAAAMDWMCEPQILQKTKLTVKEHQQRTLDNYRELLEKAPDLPWAPVLQGWTIGEYWDHVEAYQKAGVDLRKAPVVGCGTMCRRQNTTRANALIATLTTVEKLRLHAFGYKVRGLALAHEHLQSADSLAWSYRARKLPPLEGCAHRHCNNCLRFALQWRADLLRVLGIEDPPKGGPCVEGAIS